MKEIIKLGQLLGSTEQRDAIHVAVIPCVTVAGSELSPNQHVGIVDWTVDNIPVVDSETEKPIGIVDPFLRHPVDERHRFYVMLYPNTIESLRHVWRHPIIDGDEK